MENIKKLAYEKKTVYEKAGSNVVAEAFEYAEAYKKYLDLGKTERECVAESVKMAEKCGFTEYRFGDKLTAGDKKYYNNRGKNLFVFTIGTEDINNGIRISAAHVDSPRLDLKQCPLYDEAGMGFFKTHYYGGIRKYQWVATPLTLHGIVVKANGEVVNVNIGEDESEPLFYISDLLPHLGHQQEKQPLEDAVKGEQLNIIVGSMPLEGAESNAIKLNVLKYLNEKYGITEEDFFSAELSAVPADKARDIGFDRSMIGAYGHDDRVCAYPALTALLELENNEHTAMCILADKEEIGSDGVSGMQCELFLDIINAISTELGGNFAVVKANSKCLSADVSAAFDPDYAEVFEKKNAAMLGCGTVFNKYTGARGKSSTNDANAEYIGWLRGILAKDGVVWQTAELGRVDCGGGGTVAKYISKHNIETIDIGVAVISMHATYELISKVDLYETYRAIRAFYKY